jgi:uncharacterized tellurite resistance protein B-like protein
MFEHVSRAITQLFNHPQKIELKTGIFTPFQCALAGLLSEVSNADKNVLVAEKNVKHSMLLKLLNKHEQTLADSEVDKLIEQAEIALKEATSLYEYTDKLRELSTPERFCLIKSMWAVAYADGKLDPDEELVIRKTAELLHLDHSLFIKAKLEEQAEQTSK